MEAVTSPCCRLVAATSSIATFTAPATGIASPTSQRVTRSSRRRCDPSAGCPCRSRTRPGMQVDRVRHHGGARASRPPAARFRCRRIAAPARRRISSGGAVSTKRLVRNPIAMTSSRPVMTRSKMSWPRRFWIRQQQQGHHAGDHAADQQRQIEQEVQGDGAADDLGEIGCHGDEFGLRPVAIRVGRPICSPIASGSERPVTRPSLADRYCTRPAMHVGHHDDPDQQEAVLRAGADVGGDVARVDVGDRGDERGPEQIPVALQRALGALPQRTDLDSLHRIIK